jgi:TIR domain
MSENDVPNAQQAKPPRVLISYSHDTEDHASRVLELSDKLRQQGVDCHIDQYEPVPQEGWPVWMERQIKRADFVVCICTEEYAQRFNLESESGVGRGVAWEAILVRNSLYSMPGANLKFLTAQFGQYKPSSIPVCLQSYTNFVIDRFELADSGYEKLYRHVTAQPASPAVMIGKKVELLEKRGGASPDRIPALQLVRLEQAGKLFRVEKEFGDGTESRAISRSGSVTPCEEAKSKLQLYQFAELQAIEENSDDLANIRRKKQEFTKLVNEFCDEKTTPEQAKVIFPLHGIRTRGEWVTTASDTLSESTAENIGWKCRLDGWNYGRFNLFQFLTPWSRSAKVEWFRAQYESEMADRELPVDEKANLYPSVVAHSFGTYILGNALLKYKDIKFNKIILVGSILPRDFPWEALTKRGQVRAVRNEYGVDDIWTVFSSWIVRGTGASGTKGFTPLCFPDSDPRFEQEEYLYKHSDYFVKRHIRTSWRPFLENRTPSQLLAPELEIKRPRGDHPVSQLLAACLWIFICISVLSGVGYMGWRYVYPPIPPQTTAYNEMELKQIFVDLNLTQEKAREEKQNKIDGNSVELLNKKRNDLKNREPFRLVRALVVAATQKGNSFTLDLVPKDPNFAVAVDSSFPNGLMKVAFDTPLPETRSVSSINPDNGQFLEVELTIKITFVDWSESTLSSNKIVANGSDLRIMSWAKLSELK